MPYFLHKGAHIKRDVAEEVNAALSKHQYRNAHMSRHLGVDGKLVDLILQRTKEVEKRAGLHSR
jgi:precorrin-8X/cobalt-precorrin-8 methylmutase